MKFWELLRQPPRPRDPSTGHYLQKAAPAAIERRIRWLARQTDGLAPEVKALSMMIAKSDLTREEATTLLKAHRQREDIMQGLDGIIEAMRLRGQSKRAQAFLKRKDT